jgi:hypothetical protein
MHFIVAWDITASDTERNSIDAALQNALKPYASVQPFGTVYIVNVPSQEAWSTILKSLKAVGLQHPSKTRVLASPLMQGGFYDGLLPTQVWKDINEKSA